MREGLFADVRMSIKKKLPYSKALKMQNKGILIDSLGCLLWI